jgi:hypothetical protein
MTLFPVLRTEKLTDGLKSEHNFVKKELKSPS